MREHSSEILHYPLTDRESTILQLVADGLSNQDIADHLVVGLTTVKWYLKQIFNKLGVNRRTEAVKRAYALGLVNLDQLNVDPSPGLPTPATPLIGRANEVADLINLLGDPANRLVTILGPGGMGKTHLALEVARRFAGQSRSEVRFVALEGVQAVSGIAPAIADAIGFQLHGSLNPQKQLLTGLRSRKLLLVLDNCEHLLAAASDFSEMLAAAPYLKMLTTSRERLNLHGETVYALRGLAYPPESDPNHHYAAFQLFLRAARRIRPDFNPSSEESRDIAHICRLVEGMPLALELAASWMDVLTTANVAHEITTSLSILQTTFHDVPERHRSIDAVFEHSWHLLSDAERAVFMNLSVFRGGFDRAAAQAVAGAGIFVLSTLVDKSLVARVGPDRFKLHELLRQFAEAKLKIEASSYTETLLRHCQHYGSLMREYESRMKSELSSFSAVLVAMRQDFDNIVTTWQRAVTEPFVAEISQYCHCILFLLYSHGLYSFGEQTFAQALHLFQMQADSVSPLALVRVRGHYGWMLEFMSQYEEAEKVVLAALDLTGQLDETAATDAAVVRMVLGVVTQANGQLVTAREHLQQSLTLCQKVRYEFGEWLGKLTLAEVEYEEGYYDIAYRLHWEALLLSERTGHTLGTLYGYGFVGCTCCALGDLDNARNSLRRGLMLQRDLFVQWGFQAVDTLFPMVIGIAVLWSQCHQPETAVELLAIVRHHPQCVGFTQRKASLLLAEAQSRLSPEYVHAVMEDVRRGEVVSHYLETQFTINLELFDRLLDLVDSTAT